jgi:subtilisin family serine protease
MRRFALAAVGFALACSKESTSPSVVVLTPVSGDAQTGRVSTPLGAPFVVKAIDAAGQPVGGLSVTWAVTAGGGSVSPASPTTDGSGLTSATLTLGTTVGSDNQTVTASASHALGSPVTFLASAVDARIAGTVSVTKGMLAPPRVQRLGADATGVGPVFRVPSLSAKQPAAPLRHAIAVQGTMPPPRRQRFTPNELLVTFRPRALGAPSLGSPELARPGVARAVGEAIRSQLAPHVTAGQARVVGVSPALLAARLRVAAPELLDDVAASLRADASVATVERNGIVWSHGAGEGRGAAPAATTTDPYAVYQAWHYGLIDLPRAWDLTTGSASVLVAIVDDGTRFDHPDIAANLTSDGYDFVDDTSYTLKLCSGGTTDRSGDGDGYDPDPTDPMAYDVDFSSGCIIGASAAGNHGLHVAGTIGATGNNATGGTGVNWTVKIRPVRALDVVGAGTWYDVAQGVLYAAGLPADNGAGGTVQPATGARVINMSFGGDSVSTVFEAAINAASNAGALLVASAGNSGTSDPSYPAGYPAVLAVSAVGPDGRLAFYSSFGRTIGIAAPGGDMSSGDPTLGVFSTVWNFQTGTPTYAFYQGTSMAAPHVTGVAALLLAREPGLTAAALRSRLTQFAVDVDNNGPDVLYGAGIVNARNSLTQTLSLPHRLFARLYNAATGSVVATQAVGGDGSFAFTGLSDGAYQVFAGEDESNDGVLGRPGRRLGAFGGIATPTTLSVAGAGTYAAPFLIGLPLEREPNDAASDADPMYAGTYINATRPPSDVDAYRVTIVTAGPYAFETSAWNGACGFGLGDDTYLFLFDDRGNLIDSNDDIDFQFNAELGLLGGNLCSRVSDFLAPGTYYAVVAGYSNVGDQYRLEVRPGN